MRSVLLGAFVALSASGCRFDKTVSGRVLDYETGTPLANVDVRVSQSGWGFSNGSVVWDKSYETSAPTDANGAFTVHYRVGSSASVTASHNDYSEFQHYYEPNSFVALKLKRLTQNYVPLPNKYASVGVRTDGRFIGWDFATATSPSTSDSCDVIATYVEPGSRATMKIGARGNGGLLFVPQKILGVDADYLVFADAAPDTGYVREVTLDFRGTGGLIFVRTRDGGHYAKIEFTPFAFASHSDPTIGRVLDLRYVYNPAPSRALVYQHPPLPRVR